MRKAWSVVLVLGLCGGLLAAAEAAKDVKAQKAFQDFLMKWEQGNTKECAGMFAAEGAGTVTLKDAVARRGVAEGQAARGYFQMSFKTEAGKSSAKVHAQFLLTKEGAKEKQLLVIDESFVLAPQGTGFVIEDYQRVDTTAEQKKALNGFIEGQLLKLRDVKLEAPARQFNGGLACENMRALGEAGRAWPIMKEMFDLGTESVSDSNLRMFQGVLKELIEIETPPEQYRPVIEKIMALAPKEK